MSLGYGKKFITSFVLAAFLGSSSGIGSISFAEPLHGGVSKDEKIKEEQKIFTGEIHKIESKETINMTVSQVLSGAYSQEGDEFFAEITQNVKGKGGVVLPIGTIAHGTIREMGDAKRLGRDAWIEMDFDYLITPDGREIPIQAKMSSKVNPVAGGAKVVAEDLGYTVGGGAVGSYAALQLFGIEGAIASHGYTILGGAAIGGAIALGIALFRKGKDVLLSPGDEIKVKITSEVELPVISEDALKQHEVTLPGLDVKLYDVYTETDPFGGKNTYAVVLDIVNNTNMTFSSFDIAVMDEMQKKYYPSVFGTDSMAFMNLKPGDDVYGKMCFSVTDLKRKHWLVFYDKRTRKPVAKYSIDNVKAEIEKDPKIKKKRKKKAYK